MDDELNKIERHLTSLFEREERTHVLRNMLHLFQSAEQILDPVALDFANHIENEWDIDDGLHDFVRTTFHRVTSQLVATLAIEQALQNADELERVREEARTHAADTHKKPSDN